MKNDDAFHMTMLKGWLVLLSFFLGFALGGVINAYNYDTRGAQYSNMLK